MADNKWQVVRYNQKSKFEDLDARPVFEKLGFTEIEVHDTYDHYYMVTPPAGWTKEESGFTTTIKNENGTPVAQMRHKRAGVRFESWIEIL